MARTNYSYKKYQRELAKKKKKEEKLQSKIEKKKAQESADPSAASPQDPETPPA